MDRPDTPMGRRRLRAAEHRLPATPAERVEALDNITAVYPDRLTRPAGAAAVHNRLAAELAGRDPKET